MDSLTQIILGAAVGNAVLGKKIGNRALLYGAIVGTIPDLDILSTFFTDPISAIEIHRGLSHSVFFAALSAFLLGYLLYRIEKREGVRYKESVCFVFLGLFTHALLDVFTTWGTRIFWPFDYAFAFKSIFVIDPLYTLPFAFFLLLSMREKKDSPKRVFFNKLGLYVSSSYLMLTLVLKAFIFSSFSTALEEQEIAYQTLSVKPTAMNTILWNGIVETPDAFLLSEHSFFDQSAIVFQSFPKHRELAKPLGEDPLLLRLIKISEGYYTLSEKNGDIYFNDLRFGLLKNEGEEVQFAFSYRFFLDEQDKWQVEEVKKDRKDGFLLLKKLWTRMWGV